MAVQIGKPAPEFETNAYHKGEIVKINSPENARSTIVARCEVAFETVREAASSRNNPNCFSLT